MASRGPFGFRAKHPEKSGEGRADAPAGLSRKASITSTASNNPTLPKATASLFSRHRTTKPKVESSISPAQVASSIPIGRGQTSVNITSTSKLSSVGLRGESSRSAGLGISMENKTTQVSKSGKPRNVLRRKAPSVDHRSGYARTESSASSYDPPPSRQAIDTKSSPEVPSDPFPNQVLGITAPTISSSSATSRPPGLGPSFEFDTSSSRMARWNSRKTPSPAPHAGVAPPTPNYGHDSGSSTRHSDSPSSYSHSSTPTSMTSQSPGISTPVSIPSVRSVHKQIQSRPPVAMANKRRQGFEPSGQAMTGLSAVRESGTSSSSSSTVKASGSRDDSSRIAVATGRSSPLVPTIPASMPTGSNTSLYYTRRDGSGTGTISGQPTASRLPKFPADQSTSQRSFASQNRVNAPPSRPSREGVPSLDMKKLHLDFSVPRPGPANLGRSPSNASSASDQPNRLAASPIIGTGKIARPAEMTTEQSRPSLEVRGATGRTVRDPSPQSATSTKSGSRFALFSRRTKSPKENMTPDATDKAARKGPAAGTGHEGYGKYARRGRSGSMSTSASRGRSTSSNSVGRTPSSRKSSLTSRDEEQMDEFYRSRLEPKKIIGGGQSVASSMHGSEVSVSEGPQTSVSTLSRSEIQGTEPTSSNVRALRPGVPPSDPLRSHALRHVDRRLPGRDIPMQDIANRNDMVTVESSTPTLATRRSLHRSQLLTGGDPVKIPAPIDTRAMAMSPPLDSQNTYQSSFPQSDNTIPLSDDISEGREGNWLKSNRSTKSAKSPKKWTFFHRSQGSPKKLTTPISIRSDLGKPAGELRAQVSKLPESRSVAFYELINPNEQSELESGELARVDETDQQTSRSPDRAPVSPRGLVVGEQRFQKVSMLLPSPPGLAREFSDAPVQPVIPLAVEGSSRIENDPGTEISPPQPEQARKPRLQPTGRIPRVVSKRDRLHKPPPQSFSRPRPYTPRHDAATCEPPSSAPILDTSGPFDDIATRPILGLQTGSNHFPAIYSQDSPQPASAPVGPIDSTARGANGEEFLVFPPRIGSEVSGSSSSGNLSTADITAIVPKPGAAPTEEEEWNEYNDFLDIMESPAPMASPQTNPYEKTIKGPGWAPAPLEIRKDSSGSSGGSSKQLASTVPPAMPPTRKLPSPPKRSKLSSGSPVRDEQRSSDVRRQSDEKFLSTQRKSLAASSRYSASSIESEADSLADLENPTPVKVAVPAHLRLELLTISKLLSFDRVLFSPAHAEVSGNRKSRILVLDGLGVDDWAFFCAQEYPDAQISNLSATPRAVSMVKNYEHHHYPSLDSPFPFPQNYFSAAVLRFPTATSEDAYSNVIKEFRRVLCPSGYLEISILDLDMVKMGRETRKALRQLKERKQMGEPQTSLKPLSDNIQKMLGGKAFENLKQCMLEIPVASQSESSRVRSFNEKMELIDEMPRDEDRTKHLPEIGRWWFSRCYETGPRRTERISNSIWDDQSVLEECKSMETGFKMLLCYAQKPNKRRTRSL